MNTAVRLSIDGMGIAFYSAETMNYVTPESDFLTEEFSAPDQIAEHIRRGDITAFCTGTGGDFDLRFLSGYPSDDTLKEYPVSIRLGLEVRGGSVQFCDIFWLSRWNPALPQDQAVPMEDGFYDVTACTRRPESGCWGDEQTILLYFSRVEAMPELAWTGVPYLFTED